MTGFVLAAGLLSLVAVALLTRSLWWKGKAASGADAPVRSLGLAGVIAAFVVVLAVGGYAKLGAPDGWHWARILRRPTVKATRRPRPR
jgi:hypothetical protein